MLNKIILATIISSMVLSQLDRCASFNDWEKTLNISLIPTIMATDEDENEIPVNVDLNVLKSEDFENEFPYGFIGQGGFGTVYQLAVNFPDSDQEEDVIAMKVIKYADKESGMLNKELFIAQRLSYKYPLSFVQYYGCINDLTGSKHTAIVLSELMDGSLDSDEFRDYFFKLGFIEQIKVFYQMTQAVLSLHLEGFGHYDVKPDNFIYLLKDNQTIIKLIDFGLVDIPDAIGYRGTFIYMDPSMILNQDEPLSRKADVYSLGLSFHDLMCTMKNVKPRNRFKNNLNQYKNYLKGLKTKIENDQAQYLMKKQSLFDKELKQFEAIEKAKYYGEIDNVINLKNKILNKEIIDRRTKNILESSEMGTVMELIKDMLNPNKENRPDLLKIRDNLKEIISKYDHEYMFFEANQDKAVKFFYGEGSIINRAITDDQLANQGITSYVLKELYNSIMGQHGVSYFHPAQYSIQLNEDLEQVDKYGETYANAEELDVLKNKVQNMNERNGFRII